MVHLPQTASRRSQPLSTHADRKHILVAGVATALRSTRLELWKLRGADEVLVLPCSGYAQLKLTRTVQHDSIAEPDVPVE